jgi:hypothetical protein
MDKDDKAHDQNSPLDYSNGDIIDQEAMKLFNGPVSPLSLRALSRHQDTPQGVITSSVSAKSSPQSIFSSRRSSLGRPQLLVESRQPSGLSLQVAAQSTNQAPNMSSTDPNMDMSKNVIGKNENGSDESQKTDETTLSDQWSYLVNPEGFLSAEHFEPQIPQNLAMFAMGPENDVCPSANGFHFPTSPAKFQDAVKGPTEPFIDVQDLAHWKAGETRARRKSVDVETRDLLAMKRKG